MSSPLPNPTPSLERVYDYPNGFRREAESMYGWLRHEGFTPAWDMGVREGEHRLGITLPASQVPQLREFQRRHPARWGNAPEVAQAMRDNQAEMAAQAERDRARRAALTQDQDNWIEVLHQQTGLDGSSALDLNDKLHELAAQHFVLSLANVNEGGLSDAQERALEAIEGQVQDLLASVPGVQGAKFFADPRGTTVGVLFASGAADSFSGAYKVPLNPERVSALRLESSSFWEALADVPKHKP